MGVTAFVGVIIVSLIVGFAWQYLAGRAFRYEWLVVALAAAFGAVFASENFPGSYVFGAIKNWGPEADGLVFIPAVVGGVILALAAGLGIRAEPLPRAA